MSRAAILERCRRELAPCFAGERDLLALTVWQPWAWALAVGSKDYENRSWKMPPRIARTWVAIHAGARVDDREAFEIVNERKREADRIAVVRSAIVGLVYFDRCDSGSRHQLGIRSLWYSGPHGWHVSAALQLEHPVPCGGAEGLWSVTGPTLSLLADQLGLGPEASRCCATHELTHQRCVLGRHVAHAVADLGNGPVVVHDFGTLHRCHARGCDKPCPPERLMCAPHWKKVPRELQAAVWSAYRPGQCDDKQPSREWWSAAEAAIAAVAAAEAPPVPPQKRQIGLFGDG